MLAPCGLDCSTCEAYLATQADDNKKLENIARQWSKQFDAPIQPEHIICDGCRSNGRRCYYCQEMCEIINCVNSKKLATCAECEDYYCDLLVPIFKHEPEAKIRLKNRKESKQ
jgi:hypothetical protein